MLSRCAHCLASMPGLAGFGSRALDSRAALPSQAPTARYCPDSRLSNRIHVDTGATAALEPALRELTSFRSRFAPTAMMLSLLVIAALFVTVGAQYLTMPGPQGDELLQAVPAARFLNPDRSLYRSEVSAAIEILGRQWPVVAMPYLGAVKS